MPGSLFAVGDLHVSYAENRVIADGLAPESDDDWPIVAGDVAEILADVARTRRRRRGRFRELVRSPGNHEREVSLGCPREWRRRGTAPAPLRRILRP
ncbi:hypothetical protein [Plantactinospora endophytica]|uniref:Calcineurin-like phosphoesterase domain-containing protein n=1 Tax=Plantactinospora endophytica TaxID=673535 RepID=A0ABQ4E9V3_9ACTN|nr:hypothetical protein [Plantactinospora endophytica]GIG91445.1 hypothetical protein Pen02_63810 [Plantactinospora endophytica]